MFLILFNKHEKSCDHSSFQTLNTFVFFCACQSRIAQVTAFSPRLEQLSAEAGSMGALPSLKDNMVVVSAHHASTLQKLQSREKEVNEGTA